MSDVHNEARLVLRSEKVGTLQYRLNKDGPLTSDTKKSNELPLVQRNFARGSSPPSRANLASSYKAGKSVSERAAMTWRRPLPITEAL